ncbi:MAG: UvrD-helicase domain-containing protein [candidate division KSB1 bacterium]|nr:UvrD-helicase domain-containing protein [candidate division KSB1 bacterium]
MGEKAAQNITIQTFHAFGAQILRDSGSFSDARPDLRSSIRNKTIIFKSLLKESVSFKRSDLERISLLKGKGYSPDSIPPDELTGYDEHLIDVFQAYENTMLQMNAVDFDDLIGLTVRLLRQSPDIRRDLLKRYTCIAVDEFQDINHAQYDFFRIFCHIRPACLCYRRSGSGYIWIPGRTIRVF